MASFEDVDLSPKRTSTQFERRLEPAKTSIANQNTAELKMMNTQNMKNVHKTRTMKVPTQNAAEISGDAPVHRVLSFANASKTAASKTQDGRSDAEKLKETQPNGDFGQEIIRHDEIVLEGPLKGSSKQTKSKHSKPHLEIDLSKLKQESAEEENEDMETERIDVKVEITLKDSQDIKLMSTVKVEQRADPIPSV